MLDASGAGPTAPSLLMDLRPCYEGFAGIPQEARLLFSMFSGLGLARFGGLASGIHFSSRRRSAATPFSRVVEQTKALIAQDTKRTHWPTGTHLVLPDFVKRRLFKPYLMLSESLRRERLNLRIDPEIFEDYLWMKLFDCTLPASDRHIVHRAEYFATELGHEYARSLSLLPRLVQRRLDTTRWDLFFGASVSPYRVSAGTSMMIRYYDALPLLSPHTVGEPWPHALSHARMLERNMEDGAHFYCGSEPVRDDLLRFFPQAEPRVHTIPVTVSAGFFPETCPEPELRNILIRRASPETTSSFAAVPEKIPLLFMAVSTLEPRKNFSKLFRAFEMARRLTRQQIYLLVVANRGWRADSEVAELKAMSRQHTLHLTNVPADELRLLYSMSHCVVAPSRAEGFDYSGVEAMSCGTPVIASDIPVHRWVYGNAAEYFDPYDERQLGQSIARFADLPHATGHLAVLRDRGFRRAELYSAQALQPKWEEAIYRQSAMSALVA